VAIALTYIVVTSTNEVIQINVVNCSFCVLNVVTIDANTYVVIIIFFHLDVSIDGNKIL